MKNLLILSLVLSFAMPAAAVPRFAAREGVDCATCHVFPGGGAARTSYGNEYVTDYLASRSRSPLDVLTERLPEVAILGADIRSQVFSQPAAGETSIFPMQFAVYTGVELEQMLAFAQLEYRNDAFEVGYAIRYQDLPMDSWVSYARQIPAFGQKLDDHTALIRGGNLTLQGLDSEGMPFTPYLDRPRVWSVGSYPLYWLGIQIGAGSSFLDNDEDTGHSYLRVDTRGDVGPLGFQGNVSLLREGDLELMDFGAMLNWTSFVYHGSLTWTKNWPQQDTEGIAVFHELSWLLRQGIDLLLRHEFLDPQLAYSNGAISRYSLGVEYFPVPGVELKTYFRVHTLENAEFYDADRSNQLLIQLHLYL